MKKIGVVVLPLLAVAVIGCGEARTASHPTSTAPPPVLGLQERLQSRQQELAEHRREGHEQHQREITEAQEQRETAARVQAFLPLVADVRALPKAPRPRN